MRHLATEYLRAGFEEQRASLLQQIQQTEGVGPERILQMAPHLPLPKDRAAMDPGKVHHIAVNEEHRAENERPIAYSVLLPPEYHPDHQYPMVVTLRSADRTADEMLEWWGLAQSSDGGSIPGQSQRHGYIVIAPEYALDDAGEYDYGAAAHRIVLESIVDARQRFQVDSDRIFLSGHGMGADAAFDIGLSHPDLFAGVIPVAGAVDVHAIRCRDNGINLGWYIVGGEIDRDTLTRNSSTLEHMLKQGFNVVYVEHPGRGYESYYSEIQRIFEWMRFQVRAKNVKEIEAAVLRPTDNRFYWLQAHDLPTATHQPVSYQREPRAAMRPTELRADVTEANSIRITRTAAARHTIWLTPEMLDFTQQVKITRLSKHAFRGFVTPSVETILEDLRTRGDRQNIYSVRIDID